MSTEKRVAQRVLTANAAEIEIALLKPYKVGLISRHSSNIDEGEIKKYIRSAKSALANVETSGAGGFPELATSLSNLSWSLGVLKQRNAKV